MNQNKRLSPFTSDQADKLDEIKQTLCTAIRWQSTSGRYKTAKTLARQMGTNPNRVSDVFKSKLDSLTINQLFHYLVRINSDFKLQLLFKHYETKPKHQQEILTAAKVAILKGELKVPGFTD